MVQKNSSLSHSLGLEKNKKILGVLLAILVSAVLISGYYLSVKKVPNFPDTGDVLLRVLQYNTHHGGVGTDGKLDTDRFVAAAAAKNPDLISTNENEQFSSGYGNLDNVDLIRQLLNQKTGKQWKAYFFQTFGQWDVNGPGNAIFTTLDVVSTDHKKVGPNRVAGVVTVNIGGQTVNFFATHFDNISAAERLREATVLRDWMATFTSGINILAGDMNGSPNDPEVNLLKTFLTDSWAQAKIDGTAISAADNPNGNTKSSRIDYIFYPKGKIALVGAEVPDTRDASGVMPSDHRPLSATFSLNGSVAPPPPVPPVPPPSADVVIHAKNIPDVNIHGNWAKTPDTTAADGIQLYNPDLKVAKLATPKATPLDYFDVTFTAKAGTPYHIWLRMKANKNSILGDSVYIQFSDALDSSGKPIAGISTTAGLKGYLEEGDNAGISGWGWNDNGYGVLGSNISFSTTGTHTIRIQSREDGVSIDQIILSPVKYLSASPGALKNDNTIIP